MNYLEEVKKNMNKKTIGIIAVILLVGTTILTVTGTINVQSNEEKETVTLAPILNFSPTSHDFGYVQEGQAYQTTFDIWNAGTGTLDWHLGIVHPWVSPNPTMGTSIGEHDTVTVTVSTHDLSEGLHEGFVSIFSNGGDAYFNIRLTVQKGKTKNIHDAEIGWSDPCMVPMQKSKPAINCFLLYFLESIVENAPMLDRVISQRI